MNQYRAQGAANSITTSYNSYNEGKFLGFKRDAADIYAFSVTGGNVSLDNLSFKTAVPEPESYALMALGLGLLAAVAKRRRA